MLLSSLALLLIGQKLGERQGLLLGFILAMVWNFMIYYYSDQRLFHIFGGRALEGQDPWGLLQMRDALARKAKVPPPQIWICNLESPTAFSLGRSLQNSAIYLSEPLLQKLQPEELRAVLALEIAKIKRLDTLNYGIASILCAIFFGLTQILDHVIFFAWAFQKRKVLPITFTMTYPVKWLLQLTLNPKNFYEADQLAAEIYGDPRALAQVIWKLHSYVNTQPLQVPVDTAHLFVVNPLPHVGWAKHFDFQPSFQNRIKKIVGHFPI
jgi:heat shock protein HtpX